MRHPGGAGGDVSGAAGSTDATTAGMMIEPVPSSSAAVAACGAAPAAAFTSEVRLLVDGNVVPYIRFAPATAFGVLPAVIFTEIDYVTPPTPPATRRNRHP